MPDGVLQLAETIQTASINRHPSPKHDINPSTAASQKQPVQVGEDDALESDDVEDDEIPLSALRPVPRRSNLPPLPDLRFEQSYLASIKNAGNWQTVTYITIKDQVLLPLVQGIGWTLIVAGWKHFSKTLNGASRFSGQSIGARIRRWWWDVNNWSVPQQRRRVNLSDPKLAANMEESLAVPEAIEVDLAPTITSELQTRSVSARGRPARLRHSEGCQQSTVSPSGDDDNETGTPCAQTSADKFSVNDVTPRRVKAVVVQQIEPQALLGWHGALRRRI